MSVCLRIAWACALLSLVAAPATAASAPASPAPPPAPPAAAAPAPAAAKPAPAPAKAVIWGKLTAADGGKVYELSGDEVIVGTDKACQVQLDDKTVAPRHAKITHANGVIEVHDLGARGGTLVAGTAVKPSKPFRLLQPVELTFAAATLNFAFGERPSLILPTQKGRPAGKAAPGKTAPGKAGAGKAAAGKPKGN